MPECQKRKAIRIPDYEYDTPGAYFVTICTNGRAHIFGGISAPTVGAGHLAGPCCELSPLGKMVDEYVRGISSAYKNVSVDNYVIMPNHIHLLLRLEIHNGPARCPAPTQPLPKIVSAFKSLTTRTAGRPLWQRGYYEHVVRGDYDYERIWRYIDDNPAKWPEDEYYTPETTT